jgi:hypothetical protein
MRRCVAATFVAAAFLALAGAASNSDAASGSDHRAELPRITFRAEASKGYGVIGAIWHRKIRVLLLKGISGVEYIGPAHLDDGAVTATLGRRVVLKMRFRPTKCAVPRGPKRRHCEGAGGGEVGGVLVGRISIRGEHRFSEFEGARVQADRRTTGVRPGPLEKRAIRRATVPQISVQLRRPIPSGKAILRFVGFLGPNGKDVSLITAEDEERHIGFRVERTITAGGGSGSFRVSGAQGSQLSLRPPQPFRGSARLSTDGTGPPTGRGLISIVLPGGRSVAFDVRGCKIKVRWSGRPQSPSSLDSR